MYDIRLIKNNGYNLKRYSFDTHPTQQIMLFIWTTSPKEEQSDTQWIQKRRTHSKFEKKGI